MCLSLCQCLSCKKHAYAPLCMRVEAILFP